MDRIIIDISLNNKSFTIFECFIKELENGKKDLIYNFPKIDNLYRQKEKGYVLKEIIIFYTIMDLFKKNILDFHINEMIIRDIGCDYINKKCDLIKKLQKIVNYSYEETSKEINNYLNINIEEESITEIESLFYFEIRLENGEKYSVFKEMNDLLLIE